MELGPFKFLEKRIEDVPGFAYIVAAGLSIAGSSFSEPTLTDYFQRHRDSLRAWRVDGIIETLGYHETYVAFVVLVGLLTCWMLYRLGSVFDIIIFDPLYSPPQEQVQRQTWAKWLKVKWSKLATYVFGWLKRIIDRFPGVKDLDELRSQARTKLSDGGTKTVSLYKSAAKLLHRSEEWQQKVKFKLEVSKASRTLILPLLLALVCGAVYDLSGWPYMRTLAALSPLYRSIIYMLLTLLAVLAYLWFRILHMVALYRLIHEKAFWFVAQTSAQQSKKMLCIGSVVVSEDELETEKQVPNNSLQQSGAA